MDSGNPSQSPLLSKQKRVRPQKLRMSCDACSCSKIKCDQSRPVCCRCQKLNLKCNYSPSRRMGKPPAASRDLTNSIKEWKTAVEKESKASSASSSDGFESFLRRSQTAPVRSISQADLTYPATMDMSLPAFEDLTSTCWPSFMLDGGSATTTELAIAAPNNSSSSINACGNMDHDFSWMDTSAIGDQALMDPICDMLDFDDEFEDPFKCNTRPSQGHDATFSLPLSRDPLPTPPYSDSNDGVVAQGYNCTSLAALTLYNLNTDSHACTAFPGYGSSAATRSAPRSTTAASIDQILIANKSAVENVSAVLACPCSLSHQSCTILALIIDRIITRYQALIRDDVSNHPGAVATVAAAAARPTSEPVPCATRLTLGAYLMDAEDEQRMRIQLVSNELRKAMALVKKHSDRYLAVSDGKGDDGAMYTTLTSFLKGRLSEAMKETAQALRSSVGS